MKTLRAFTMPKWGIEMTEGTIAEWMVKEGETFPKGQVLCLIETSKITNEVEAEYSATVYRIVTPAASEARPVGALLAVFGDADVGAEEVDQFIAKFTPAGGAGTSPTATPPADPAPRVAEAPPHQSIRIVTNRAISPEAHRYAEAQGVEIEGIEGSGPKGRITLQDVMQASRPAAALVWKGPVERPSAVGNVFASPLAVRIAALEGIDLTSITGTGPRGRISKADVLAAGTKYVQVRERAFNLAPNDPTVVSMDKVRKIIATRLTAAKQDIPHFYLRQKVAIDALLSLRRTANLVLPTKATINDYLVRAAALALTRHPDINIQVHGTEIHRFVHPDIAIAVASPHGLVTPIIRQPNRMTIEQTAAETARLIGVAQAGRLSYNDMSGGTFSISNLGMFGIEQFDAIINPPQAAILAVGGITREMVEGERGVGRFESRLSLSLSCDHRAIDGAIGAAFMKTLRELLEAPEEMFLDLA